MPRKEKSKFLLAALLILSFVLTNLGLPAGLIGQVSAQDLTEAGFQYELDGDEAVILG